MLEQLNKRGKPDVIVPIVIDSVESVEKKVSWLHDNFGFTCFSPIGPSKGFRSTGYPSRDKFVASAENFAKARELIKKKGLFCGWYCNLTLKSGASDKFTPIIRADGSAHPFANCPLDPTFRDTLSSDIAAYADIALPDFIILEDDFSISAAGGCFCENHLRAFAGQMGARYERDELARLLTQTTPEALKARRVWAELKRDSLVCLATKIRKAIHRSHPETPIGLMQSGTSDRDGNMTAAIARALAGDKHQPFVRLHGTFYSGFKAKELPSAMFNSLYHTEHSGKDILYYHESDSYPHTRYYSSGVEMCALLSAAYSIGMVGSIFFAMQSFDEPWEEPSYGKHFAREHKRLSAISKIAEGCEPFGVEITYDPYYNAILGDGSSPQFKECIGRFGIPQTTKTSSVAFWDKRQAEHRDDDSIMQYLSHGLVLDADSAKELCRLGFGKYLGVSVGEPLKKIYPKLSNDLGAREVITPDFAIDGMGRRMWCAHCYAPSGGKEWVELKATDPKTEIITEAVDFSGNVMCPAMTYYENELGGRVCVIAESIDANHSQSIFNYRRAALIQRIVTRMSDEYPMVTDAPDVYLVATKPKKESGIQAALTVINLCTDEAEDLHIYLPPSLRDAKEFLTLNYLGELEPLKAQRCPDGLKLTEPVKYCVPCYVFIK